MNDTATRRRVAPKSSPTDAARLSRDELRRLAKAERKASAADPALAVSGRREIAELERRRRIRLDDAALAAGLAETLSLARVRGEEVRAESLRIAAPALDEHGAPVLERGLPVYRRETISRMRMASRGGLQLAFERGDLDGGPLKAERLLDVGKTYRWAFEASSGLRTPARDLSTVSARAPLRASAGPQDAVFAAGELLRALRENFSDRQRQAADRVCGLDMTVRATALALKADPRTVRRTLVEALTLAAQAQRKPAAA